MYKTVLALDTYVQLLLLTYTCVTCGCLNIHASMSMHAYMLHTCTCIPWSISTVFVCMLSPLSLYLTCRSEFSWRPCLAGKLFLCAATYIHLTTYLPTYPPTCLPACLPACMHACMHACIRTYVYTDMYTLMMLLFSRYVAEASVVFCPYLHITLLCVYMYTCAYSSCVHSDVQRYYMMSPTVVASRAYTDR